MGAKNAYFDDELRTTASFVITVPHLRWIKSEAKRRDVSASEIVRDLIAAAMATESDTTETEHAA